MRGYHNCGQGATFVFVPRQPTRSKRAFNPKIAFGLVLRQLRQERGHSQDAFAHLVGSARMKLRRRLSQGQVALDEPWGEQNLSLANTLSDTRSDPE